MPDVVILIVLSVDHMGRKSDESSDRDEEKFTKHPAHQEALLPAKCKTGSVRFLSSPFGLGILIAFLEEIFIHNYIYIFFVNVS